MPKPRAVTYSGTFHQWTCIGVRCIRTFPTIWVHMCNVWYVSCHSASGRAGQARSMFAREGEGFMAIPPFGLATKLMILPLTHACRDEAQ